MSGFIGDSPLHSTSRSIRLSPMSADTFYLVGAAMRCICAGCRGDPAGNGFAYIKVGVMLDDLVRAEDAPPLLFEPEWPKSAKLMKALDEVNDRFGKKTLVLGAEGFKRPWALKAEHRSPRYTTRIADLPVVAV